MGRINKLETDVELDVVPGSQHHPSSSSPLSSSGLSSYTSQNYEHYGKEFFFGNKHRDMLCTESEDSFLRPPLWEDITSSIQNIDPENAIMLGTMNGIPQVKMEAVDDPFLEPLSSPLLSPLEIKTEKSNLLAQNATNHNNNLSHLHNNNNNSIHQNHMHSDNPPRRTPPPPYHQQQQQQQHQQQLQGNHIHHHTHGGMVGAQSGVPVPTSTQLLQPPVSMSQPTQPNPITSNGSLHPLPAIPNAIGTLGPVSGTANGSGPGNTGGPPVSTRNGTSSRGSSSKRQSSAHSINSVLSSAGVVKHIVGRYNRRNNPELEKRRIHHCDFIANQGYQSQSTESFHVSAHLSLYTQYDSVVDQTSSPSNETSGDLTVNRWVENLSLPAPSSSPPPINRNFHHDPISRARDPKRES
uniref:Uncharacterized protein n=1 Tax=Anopheles culicifacies TaxID=139723 RepID=A0A182LTR7_9DIPT